MLLSIVLGPKSQGFNYNYGSIGINEWQLYGCFNEMHVFLGSFTPSVMI